LVYAFGGTVGIKVGATALAARRAAPPASVTRCEPSFLLQVAAQAFGECSKRARRLP
jgi:hypothetical protein